MKIVRYRHKGQVLCVIIENEPLYSCEGALFAENTSDCFFRAAVLLNPIAAAG